MAANVLPHVSSPQQVHSVPHSFGEAVIYGWKLVRETTVLGADRRHRHGSLILAKPGSPGQNPEVQSPAGRLYGSDEGTDA